MSKTTQVKSGPRFELRDCAPNHCPRLPPNTITLKINQALEDFLSLQLGKKPGTGAVCRQTLDKCARSHVKEAWCSIVLFTPIVLLGHWACDGQLWITLAKKGDNGFPFMVMFIWEPKSQVPNGKGQWQSRLLRNKQTYLTRPPLQEGVINRGPCRLH